MSDADLLLRRDEALPIPEQIAGILRERIASGEYAPGKRLDSVRKFAGAFDVSPVTVIRALDILEAEALIQRVPMKGVYVTDRQKAENRQLNVCFAFPEKELSPENMQKENWALSSELQRGLMSAAAGKNTVLQFVFFEDTPSPALLKQQLAELKKYDMAIFVGHQLGALQEAAAGTLAAFRMMGDKLDTCPAEIIPADYDREQVFLQMAKHIKECGCRTAGIIGLYNEKTAKTDMFRKACESYGITVEERFMWLFEDFSQGELAKKLKGERPEFFYCMSTELVPDIYETAGECALKIGKDFQMAGIATGITLAGLIPQLTYFRIPRFEMGQKIMTAGIESVRTGKKLTALPLFPAEFIQGKSTNLKK